ncbi:hypothetical protein L1987_65793 [Smallanthus sonchifolius]|uniref:Uncharacterized protein n=1 Tax=Smallanthus sonchifolius TaxID=185202 RepID=A0ACB9BVG9_9ASTR|nr:hypothetical protein L1987_65793 [Smallanthus sonchifolius]
MDLRVSARRPRMSYKSGPDDKEISDDDDDDRNHKHRRRDDARSRSLEDEVTEHVSTKPYRRGSKPFQNGHPFGETRFQSGETWKKYSFNPQFSRGPSDLNQKSRVNQPFSGDPGAVGGRGRNSSQWSRCEPRFSSLDIASQTVQQGPIPHSLFAGKGLATSSNSHGQSWSPFGLVPGIPNGSLDMFHLLGLQGTYRPAINSSLNMGPVRQRCRDFEEQGFCLRGDMCPMEHGMNRIVVEDVQSLSQFNLPISLASANLSIAPVGTGPTPATSVVTNTLPNSKGPHGKNIQHGIGDIDSAAASDGYDPDQPLWSNASHTSTGLQPISQPNVGKNDSLLDHGLSGDHRVGQSDGSDNELATSSGAVASLKTRSSVQSRINSITKRTEVGENVISKASPSNFLQNETTSNGTEDPFQHQKLNNSDSSLKVHSGNGHMHRKPSQKAQLSSVVNKRKDDFQSILHDSKGSHAPVSSSDHPKPMVVEGTKVTPPLQKKLESLELLKEELRKKQEMLDQKRNDFRRKLDKLAKQARGPKGEVAPEQLAKKQKLEVLADSVKAATLSGGDRDDIVQSAQDEVAATSSKPVGPSGKQSFKTNLALSLPESSLSLVNLGSPVVNNRFKLDNRPTAFKVVPPLPDGLADVPVLKEHFSTYGDLSNVQVDDPKTSNVTAQIHFRTRHAAEKAFLGGKTWKGHNLQFVWLNSSNSRKDSPKTTSQQQYTSGDGDSEKTDGTETVKDDTEPYETHQSNCVSDTE